MLAARRAIKLNGIEVERTPLVVPSFSSKCLLRYWSTDQALEKMSNLIGGPLLISAYDLHYGHVTKFPEFASPIFLDSGGYEAGMDTASARRGEGAMKASQPWSRELHEGVLAKWTSASPSVFISYDHPDDPLLLPEQITRARNMAANRTDVVREFLIKPEPGASFVNIPWLEANTSELADFDIVGVPDEELGSSLRDRVLNVARLRKALSQATLHTPIHVFGSLDPFISSIYFLSGADIFDGLAWLRYAFDDAGRTMYLKQDRARRYWKMMPAEADMTAFVGNYLALEKLQGAMRQYLKGNEFKVFSFGDELEQAYNMIAEEMGE